MGLALAMVFVGCAREPVATLIAKGQEALREGRFEEAAGHLRRAARAKSDSVVLQYNLGMAELESARLADAAKAFTRAAELTTDGSTDALEGLARARQLQGRWDEARTAYEEATRKAGRLPRLLAGMAASELKAGNGEAALALLSEALSQDIDDPASLYNMACLQRDVFGDSGAAASYFGRFLAVTPDSEDAARDRASQAIAALRDGRPATSARSEALILRSRQAATGAEAIRFAAQASEEDPISADALWNLGGILAKHGADRDRTVRTYAQFVRLFPDDARKARIPAAFQPVQAERALASARASADAGRWAAAVAAYRQALAVDDRDPEAWLALSRAAQHVPDLETSLSAASKALALRPNYPDAVYQLGTVQHLLGRKDAAVENIRRYLQLIPDGAHKDAVAKWLRQIGG
jgi:tetratricopeptide (TPR) repeat protein